MAKTDLVVVVPGITGSTLSLGGKAVWAPSAGALVNGIRTFGGSLKRLELPYGIGDSHPEDGVEAVAVMPDVHLIPGVWSPIRGYSWLIDRLNGLCREGKIGKVVAFPYDWRLSNRYSALQLKAFVADELGQWQDSDPSRTDARVVFVCHSMGGLVARWYIEKCGGIDVTRKLITLGTPYRGAARAIDQLVNGVRKGFGKLGIDLSAFARSMPSSHQLLPDYACVDQNGDLFRLDEINVSGIDTAMLADGLRFHRDLAAAEADRVASLDMTHAIVGVKQPTATTVRFVSDGVELLDSIGNDNHYGDATVPLAGAIGHGLSTGTNRIRRIADRHGSLQHNQAAWDEIESVITATEVRYRDEATATVRVDAPEIILLGEELAVVIDIEVDATAEVPAVAVQLIPEGPLGPPPVIRQPRVRDLHAETSFTPTQPGAYRVDVTGVRPGAIKTVTAAALVWSPV